MGFVHLTNYFTSGKNIREWASRQRERQNQKPKGKGLYGECREAKQEAESVKQLGKKGQMVGGL